MAAILFKKRNGKWYKIGRVTDKSATEIRKTDKYDRLKARYKAEGCELSVKDEPTMTTLGKWSFDGRCKTPDGCVTEPDGDCPHGWSSWLIYAGAM